MFATDQYQLLDFGGGRKLERFGSYVLDRPAPAARDIRKRKPELWEQADAQFQRGRTESGRWTFARRTAPAWTVRHALQSLELKFTSFGHLGIFPEQASNWDWIADRVRAAQGPVKVLNLFAYTGASTLAAVGAGAEVTHVDAATAVVTWAQRNAKASQLADAPIRWITEDAARFVRRELRRKNYYDAVILDPPAYGHGPSGEVWKLEENLGELLQMCLELTANRRQFLLLTCHSNDWAFSTPLMKFVVGENPELRDEGKTVGSDLQIVSAAGGRLHCGASVRWTPLPSAPRPGGPKQPPRATGKA